MNQNGGSRTETLVKLILIFVISLLSFSVGTFVGKQFSDSQHKMAALEKEFNMEEPQREVASENGENSEAPLTDEDIAKLTQEFIDSDASKEAQKMAETMKNDQPTQKPTKKEVIAKTETTKDTTMPHKAPSAVAQRLMKDQSPTADTKPMKRKPASLPKMSAAEAIGKYTVQIASYGEEKDAKSHAARLTKKGFSAFYLEANIKGRKWYRVSVGLFGSRKSASEYRTQFMKQAQVSSALVQKIVK